MTDITASAGPQQFVRLYNDTDERQQVTQLDWPERMGWPPPEKLYRLVGRSGPQEALVTEEGLEETKANAEAQETTIEAHFLIQPFVLVRASKLDTELVAAGSYVARGAVYVMEHDGTLDIRCARCGKTPDELHEYSQEATESTLTPTQYVQREEGTYNHENGHFLCTECYMIMGAPTAGNGRWIAP